MPRVKHRGASRGLPLACLLPLLLQPAFTGISHAEIVNRIVLRVNDQIATLRDYQERREDAVREILRVEQDASARTRELSQVGELVFRNLFQELLLSSRADQLGVEVTDQELNQELARVRERNGIKSDQEFATALAESGLTETQLRNQMRTSLRQREVAQREIAGKVKVKEEDLRRFYNKNLEKFRMPQQVQLHEVVVLDDSGRPQAELEAAAATIRREAAAGKSLADAAAPFTASKQASGLIDHGWVSPGDLDPSLEPVVWKLGKGEVSEPIKARGGLHILKVLDQHPSRIKAFTEVQAQIQAQESERVYVEEFAKYLADLEKHSLVVADPPQEAANFRSKLGTNEAGPASIATPPSPATPPPPEAPLQQEVKPAPGAHRPATLPTPAPVNPSPVPPPGAPGSKSAN